MSGDDLVLLATIGMLIVQGLKIFWVGLLGRAKPSVGFMRILVMVISIGYGYLNTDISLPVLDDPLAFITALVSAAGAVLVVAHNAYEVILEPILKWIDVQLFSRAKGLLAPIR